uniref:Putative secreted protein n=1 Tax=Rhipicephalus microplus TaxID=6941 RepID=A0A6M2DAR1_RHIMP
MAIVASYVAVVLLCMCKYLVATYRAAFYYLYIRLFCFAHLTNAKIVARTCLRCSRKYAQVPLAMSLDHKCQLSLHGIERSPS